MGSAIGGAEGGKRQVLRSLVGRTKARVSAGRGEALALQISGGGRRFVRSTVGARLCRSKKEARRRHAVRRMEYLDLFGRERRLPTPPQPRIEGIRSGSCYRRSMWLIKLFVPPFQRLARLAGIGGRRGLCCGLLNGRKRSKARAGAVLGLMG